LPNEKEWEVAASRENHPRFPWGDGDKQPNNPLSSWKYTTPGGLNSTDRSIIGCYDMRGNVREWCVDLVSNNSECAVRGGSFDDTKPEDFDVKLSRKLPQVSHNRDVGFRGVIRFSVEK
jgi:formylglycine-generating enzyme required for sulfatase activity